MLIIFVFINMFFCFSNGISSTHTSCLKIVFFVGARCYSESIEGTDERQPGPLQELSLHLFE